MPLTSEQAFKVGFLMKCAEEGLTIEQTKQRVKTAIQQKKAIIGEAIKAVPSMLSTLGMLGIAAPVAAGAGVGYLAAKGTGSSNNVVADAKQDEVVGEYQRLAEEARRRSRIKLLQQATGRRVIALTPGDS